MNFRRIALAAKNGGSFFKSCIQLFSKTEENVSKQGIIEARHHQSKASSKKGIIEVRYHRSKASSKQGMMEARHHPERHH
jgi:hypothetical protein